MEENVFEITDDGDDINKEDENRFGILCTNVVNCMIHLQNSHSELLEFKSILSAENIAPSILVKLSIINGNIFRNLSDLHNPLGELIRLVKVYSESWETKSKSLRKLHKDYEKKAGNLNMALRKLAQQNEESKRIKRQEILQNWELFFTRIQMNRNHGRRWKYRMFEFKVKVEQGTENLQDYFQQLFDEDNVIKTKKDQVILEQSNIDYKPTSQNVKFDIEVLPNKDSQNIQLNEDEEYQESLEDEEYIESPEPVEMFDVSVGTSDLNFSQSLILRIYQPKGFPLFSEIGFRIIYGDNIYSTNDFIKQLEFEEEIKAENKVQNNPRVNSSQPGKSKGGLIGRRKNKQIDPSDNSNEHPENEPTETKLNVIENIKETRILIPSDVISGLKKDISYQSIKILLFTNNESEKNIGQVTIDLEELKDLDLQIFEENTCEESISTSNTAANAIPFPNLEPMSFPIYTCQDTKDELVNLIGQLPIACFYSRNVDHVVYHKATEMQSFNSLVEELTGINLDVISKEELTKEKIDATVSPIQICVQDSENDLTDVTSIINKYEKEIKSIRQFYENKIKEVLELSKSSIEQEVANVSKTYHKDCGNSPINLHKYQQRNKLSSKSRDTLSTSGPDDLDISSFINMEQELIENENKNVFIAKSRFPEQSNEHDGALILQNNPEIGNNFERKVHGIYLVRDEFTEDVSLALSDISYPALFMPLTNSAGTVYNPRAHQYFHPIGLQNRRISQPASILKLPSIKNNQVSVLNLFKIGKEMQIKSFDIKSPNK